MSRARRGPVRRAPGEPGRIRIIGGEWRGRSLALVPGVELRPTPDRVRETLFNWLMPMLPGARCLDLYAGTGALGLEALSRGAAESCFVEREPRTAAAIDAALRRFGGRGEVHVADARRWLGGTPASAFDLAFVDPPYGKREADKSVHGKAQSSEGVLAELCTLLARGWLSAHAWVYLEMSSDQSLPTLPEGWYLHQELRAGAVRSVLVRLP